MATLTIPCDVCGVDLDATLDGPFTEWDDALEVVLSLTEQARQHVRAHDQ